MSELEQKRLAAIQLPADLSGKSVLHIGCGEGFFCREAVKRGAERVVGIDNDAAVIDAAKEQDVSGKVDFRTGDLTKPPNERFDIVLLLSVLDTIPSPARFFDRIRGILTYDGRLIVELGLVFTLGKTVVRAITAGGERSFPTAELFTKVWLKGFASTVIGYGPREHGDPVARFIFRCQPAATNVFFIIGRGGIGKTNLAAQIDGAPVIACDVLLTPFRVEEDVYRMPVDRLRAAKSLDTIEIEGGGTVQVNAEQVKYDTLLRENANIAQTWTAIENDPGTRAYFSGVIADAIRQCAGQGSVVVEGFVLDVLTEDIKNQLGEAFRCWRVSSESP